jgi:glycerol-3-phosphate acyltransferase PlsY
MVTAICAVIGGYVFGGIPIGLLVGRTHGIRDIRQHGSGNIGASNVLRLLGSRLGLMVWVLDALKGYLPVTLSASLLHVGGWWLAGVAVAAIAGHCFSPFLRLTGGKGVSTSLGVIIGLDWRAGLICFGMWFLVVLLTRYISLGSMIGSGLAAPVLWLLRQEAPSILAGGLLGALVIERHKANIQRLLQGKERRIGQRERPSPAAEEES